MSTVITTPSQSPIEWIRTNNRSSFKDPICEAKIADFGHVVKFVVIGESETVIKGECREWATAQTRAEAVIHTFQLRATNLVPA